MSPLVPARLDLASLRSVSNALVVGMGRSGQEAARLLLALGVDAVTCTDLRSDAPKVDGTTALYGGHTRSDFLGRDLIVVSPGVPGDLSHLEAATGHGIPVVGELGLAAAVLQDPSLPGGARPLVAVTGTNGKSTTVHLAGQLLEQAGRRPFVGGNLGAPLSLAALGILDGTLDCDCVVAEVSSYQLERPGPLRPQAAVVLNLTPDHLARHGDLQTYAAAKLALFQHQQEEDLAVLPVDDPWLPRTAVERRPRVPQLRFLGSVPGVLASPDRLVFEGTLDDGELSLAGYGLRGAHMALNLGAALLLTQTLGVAHAAIDVSALQPLPHRMEPVPSRDGRTWLNDSKATNVDAARVGIAAAPAGCTLLLGGKGKSGADYTALVPGIRARVGRVVAFGATGAEIAATLAPLLPDRPVLSRATLGAAVDEAAALTPQGAAILLCPACASFDEFQNFEHRGDVFRTLAAAAPEASP